MTSSDRPIALVTGATAGLGREFARQLAGLGYDLVLVARDAQRLDLVASELRELAGAESELIAADLTRDEDVDGVVERIDRSPIHLLVNNAGFGTRGSLARASREEQDAMVRLHVLASHRLAQAALQSMVGRKRGVIINVSSIASFITSPGNVNYSASKAWQRVFTESLALELRGKGVYVQALCPGYTNTEFHERGGMNKGHVPGWWWLDAEDVVASSLRAVRRRRPVVVVPGVGYKVVVLLLRILPRWCWNLVIMRVRRPRGSGASGP